MKIKNVVNIKLTIYSIFFVAIFFFSVSCNEQIQQESVPIKDYYTVQVKSKEVLINGDTFELNAPVIEVNGCTYLPLRFFAERFNAENLAYDAKTEKITFSITRPIYTPKKTIITKEPEVKKSDPIPEIEKNPIFINGNGQQATNKFDLIKGLVTFKMTNKSQNLGNSNFIIWLIDSEGNNVDLLVNIIGDFNGSKAVRIDKSGKYLLNVDSDGDWSVTIN